MNLPKISVIMSNYNSEKYVGATIESVLLQSFSNFEFIIIDDASTDCSRDIMDKFEDKRIKRFYLTENQHMCYAFNYAIEKSKGEYIARIDCDDTWNPDKLEKQLEYMEQNLECGACFTLVNIIDEQNRTLVLENCERVGWFETGNREQHEWLRHFYFNGSCLCHPSAMIRKSVLNIIGVYNYSLVQIQDYDMWVRIVKKAPIYVIQEKLTNYRWFTTGINVSAPSKTTFTRSNYEFTYVLSNYFEDIPDELFIQAFQNDFIYKDSCNPKELECEKLFLLLKPVFCGNLHRIGGMNKMVKLLQDNDTRAILKDKYGVNQKNLYEMSAIPILFEDCPPTNFSNKTLIKIIVKNLLIKVPLLYKVLIRIKNRITSIKKD